MALVLIKLGFCVAFPFFFFFSNLNSESDLVSVGVGGCKQGVGGLVCGEKRGLAGERSSSQHFAPQQLFLSFPSSVFISSLLPFFLFFPFFSFSCVGRIRLQFLF